MPGDHLAPQRGPPCDITNAQQASNLCRAQCVDETRGRSCGGHFAVALLLPKQKVVLGQMSASGGQQGRDLKRQRRFPNAPLKHRPGTGPGSQDFDIAGQVKLRRHEILGERYALKCRMAAAGAASQKLSCCSQNEFSDIFMNFNKIRQNFIYCHKTQSSNVAYLTNTKIPVCTKFSLPPVRRCTGLRSVQTQFGQNPAGVLT